MSSSWFTHYTSLNKIGCVYLAASSRDVLRCSVGDWCEELCDNRELLGGFVDTTPSFTVSSRVNWHTGTNKHKTQIPSIGAKGKLNTQSWRQEGHKHTFFFHMFQNLIDSLNSSKPFNEYSCPSINSLIFHFSSITDKCWTTTFFDTLNNRHQGKVLRHQFTSSPYGWSSLPHQKYRKCQFPHPTLVPRLYS